MNFPNLVSVIILLYAGYISETSPKWAIKREVELSRKIEHNSSYLQTEALYENE